MTDDNEITWEGYVEELCGDFFIGRMHRNGEEEDMEIPYSLVNEKDIDSLDLDTIFKLILYLRQPDDYVTDIKIELSKEVYTQEQLDMAEQEAEQRLKELNNAS